MIELDKATTPSSPPGLASRRRIRKKGEEGAGLLGQEPPAPHRHFTWRSIIAGVLIGGLMCFSNMYFGLQTGWVTMGSLQSTILGFLLFRLITNFTTRHKIQFTQFSYLENVLLQSAAVATATMPLAGGFVGIIPALASLGHHFSYWQLTLWGMGVAFFGVFFAVPLRTQTILKEKLKFPSGTATAQMIHTLHKLNDPIIHTPQPIPLVEGEFTIGEDLESKNDDEKSSGEPEFPDFIEEGGEEDEEEKREWARKIKYLLISFLSSSAILFTTYFIPILGNIPVMSWIGLPYLTMFSWTITPSLSYVGQGMIMGPKTGVSMILGALFGWGILGPIARYKDWAPGPVDNWQTGAKGWIMWTSLAIMLGESISALLVISVKAVKGYYDSRKRRIDREKYGVETSGFEDDADPAPQDQQVPRRWWILGLVASSLLCMCTVSPMFGMPFHEPLIAVIFACLTSVLAVRALGETDLNPVSGIGKMSQIVFAGVAPGNVVANLIAGAISEAGAQQAGDLMQDLKTGHLLRASPRAQFYAQLIGSFFSVFFTVAAYQLYSTAYTIPSDTLPAPTAAIWLDMAELVTNGGHLPQNVALFCIILGIIAALFPIVTAIFPHWDEYLPSCVAFAVAMYVTPNWTIARVVGSLIEYLWKKKRPISHEKYMILVASGFVLGEGITSIFTAVMKTCHVPHFHT